MSLVKRGNTWHYDVAVDGKRYRGSTKQRVQSKARQFEAALIAEIQSGTSAGFFNKKSPTLKEHSDKFLDWVDQTDTLKHNTRRYYRVGWDRLAKTSIADMRLTNITTDAVSMVKFEGSPAWGNQARRTLSVMLAHAVRNGLLRSRPTIRLARENGRDGIMDDVSEKKLLAVAQQPLRDMIVIMRDTGLRPDEVFRMRWEHVNVDSHLYFNPHGKSRKARRYVALSQRVINLLQFRKGNSEEWVFPSARSESGHLTTVAKQFREARKAAGLPKNLVLYHARHAFGTYVMAQTGNPALVRDAMGHADLRTTMIYQHPDLDPLRAVIDNRNARVM